ncbi:MAG TPA: thermonuclease family protein, partial [Dehalococcoidia bacterium]|nr:thermonuclease family protein [Dehalococcoidia bacterium]
AFVFFLEFIIETGSNAQGAQPLAPEPLPHVDTADRSLVVEARVLRVIGGDAIEVELNGRQVEVSYAGSHVSEPCTEKAAERNRKLVEGQTVFLFADASLQDREGAVWRYVFIPDGRLVDAILVREGLTRAWRRDGTYQEVLINLEGRARHAAAGCLWRE